MNSILNNLSNQNNRENADFRLKQKKNLIKNDYFQINKNKKISMKNSYNDINNINNNYNTYKNNKNYNSKSFNHIDDIYKNNKANKTNVLYKNKNIINLNKKNINYSQYQIKENEYMLNLAMNNLNKYKDNLIKENNPKISNQINNQKFTNNIINYCLINPNNNLNIKKECEDDICINGIYNKNNIINIEDDILNDESRNIFPQPEPIPIKISKSNHNLSQIKNDLINLKQTMGRNNNNINNNYKKYINSSNNNFNINNSFILPNYKNNYLNHEDIKIDKYSESLFYNCHNKYCNETNKISLKKNLSQENIFSNKKDYNNNNNVSENKLFFVLNSLDLSYLINVFERNYIDFNDLLLLTREDLVEMKIPIGPRNKIINFIQEYKKYMKSFEFNELSNFIKYYKSNNILSQEQKIDNNCLSTSQTTINELTNRIKRKSNEKEINNNNNILSNEKRDEDLEKLKNSNYIKEFNLDSKEKNKNNNTNFYLLNFPYNHKKESIEKNNININNSSTSSTFRNIKINSYSNYNKNKYKKNNSVTNKERIIRPYISKKSKINKGKKDFNSYIFNKSDKVNQNENNIKKSIPINNKFYLTNPIKKLIGINNKTKKYDSKNNEINQNYANLTYYNKNNNNIKTKNNKQKNESKITNKIKRSKSIISDPKMKNDSYYKNEKSINCKIIENFRNINNEIENFQNHYKKLKKASYDRENKIKNLLIEDNPSSRQIDFLKQQIKDIEANNLYDLKNEYEIDSNSGMRNNKNLVFKNICHNRNINNLKSNNNLLNNSNNALIYEFNIENEK